MAWLLGTGFRLLLWFLLTADGSAVNLLIGLALAVALPKKPEEFQFFRIAQNVVRVALVQARIAQLGQQPFQRDSDHLGELPYRHIAHCKDPC